jgi:ABC-type multidrug transport system ATPase subunit
LESALSSLDLVFSAALASPSWIMPDIHMSEQPAIVFEAVTKRYRLDGGARERLLDALVFQRFRRKAREQQEFLALDDVSFKIERGRRMGLIGPNGAGKTTLLKLISGNFRPSSGRLFSRKVQAAWKRRPAINPKSGKFGQACCANGGGDH